jgi:hypothetical protein
MSGLHYAVLQRVPKLIFRMQVEDNSGSIERAVVLHRQEGTNSWESADLLYDDATGWAEAFVPPIGSSIHYLAQAADPTGNVALALDHGKPFHRTETLHWIYLPLVLKNYY